MRSLSRYRLIHRGGPDHGCARGCRGRGNVGRITGALIGLGIPEYEAKRYEGRVKSGGILLSVHSDNSDWTRKAQDVLERTGTQDIASAGEAGAAFMKTDKPMSRAS